VSDDPGDRAEGRGSLSRRPQRPEPGVEDVVLVVRPEDLAVHASELDLRPEVLQGRGRGPPAKGMDLHGDRGLRPQPGHELRLVDDHDELPRRGGDDLLPEQGAPEALDEVELRIDLVRPVDAQVEPRMLLERGERGLAMSQIWMPL